MTGGRYCWMRRQDPNHVEQCFPNLSVSGPPYSLKIIVTPQNLSVLHLSVLAVLEFKMEKTFFF